MNDSRSIKYTLWWKLGESIETPSQSQGRFVSTGEVHPINLPPNHWPHKYLILDTIPRYSLSRHRVRSLFLDQWWRSGLRNSLLSSKVLGLPFSIRLSRRNSRRHWKSTSCVGQSILACSSTPVVVGREWEKKEVRERPRPQTTYVGPVRQPEFLPPTTPQSRSSQRTPSFLSLPTFP